MNCEEFLFLCIFVYSQIEENKFIRCDNILLFVNVLRHVLFKMNFKQWRRAGSRFSFFLIYILGGRK